jgi:hypothetical protein
MDQTMRLSAEASAKLAADIGKQLKSGTADADFCGTWPNVKKVLLFVSGYIKPVWPAGAKVIGDLITLGDAAYELGCKPIPQPGPGKP